jgi:phenylalanyl-tRNA synthetase alpha chain
VSHDWQVDLERQVTEFLLVVGDVGDPDELYELQVQYLGKKGSVTGLRAQMGGLDPEQRKSFGQAFNAAKQAIEAALEERRRGLADAARQRELQRRVDLTMLADRRPLGTLHPITRTRRELARVFRGLGFDVVDGPHVEHEKYNFDDLNIGPDHPARDMQDTFFVADRAGNPGSLVLRTHTSPVQVRTMLERKPPVRIVAIGTVFRKDEDATHTPMFHQIEGLCVDAGVTMADLKATLYRFVGAFFGADLQVRFRPSFFPFVEPGAEFDIECPFCPDGGPRRPSPHAGKAVTGPPTPAVGSQPPRGGARGHCQVCKGAGWIELGGSGMVHPAVFEACGYDPSAVSGWAFGFGIERMAMMLHDVPDLRLLFEGDTRFLEQFPC